MSSARSVMMVVLSVGAILFSVGTAYAHGISIGRNAAGQLKIQVEVAMPIALPPSIYPGIVGYANATPGVVSAEADEPANDFFQLAPNCSLEFELVSMQPGVQIVTSHVHVPGETTLLGSPPSDFHFIWNLPNPAQHTNYSLQVLVRDLNGIYTQSAVTTLTFTADVPHCHCHGDMDDDDAHTGADIPEFVHCVLEAGPGGAPDSHCLCADMDADGALDANDLAEFVQHLLDSHGCH